MTGNLLIDLGISVIGIGMMVMAVLLVFPAASVPLDEARAQTRLGFDEPDFIPIAWLFDNHGNAVLSEGEDGSFALVYRMGSHLSTRRFQAEHIRVTMGDALRITIPGDIGASAAKITAPGADDWAQRLQQKKGC